MRLVLAFSLVLVTSSVCSGWDRYETALVASTAADFITTEIGLARGVHEANPLMRKRGVRIATGAAQVVLFDLLYRKLRKDGHDGWAKALILMPTVAHFGAAGWNVSVMAGVSW